MRDSTRPRFDPSDPLGDKLTPNQAFRFLPQPLVSLALMLLWLLLVDSLHPRMLLLGAAFGIVIPWLSVSLTPVTPHIYSWGALLRFLPVFFYDLVVANLNVAWLIIRPSGDLRSHWLVMPLDAKDPYTITTLASVISLTPGTVSARLNAEGTCLLIHALDVADPAAEVAQMKSRYEAPLREIFEA